MCQQHEALAVSGPRGPSLQWRRVRGGTGRVVGRVAVGHLCCRATQGSSPKARRTFRWALFVEGACLGGRGLCPIPDLVPIWRPACSAPKGEAGAGLGSAALPGPRAAHGPQRRPWAPQTDCTPRRRVQTRVWDSLLSWPLSFLAGVKGKCPHLCPLPTCVPEGGAEPPRGLPRLRAWLCQISCGMVWNPQPPPHTLPHVEHPVCARGTGLPS